VGKTIAHGKVPRYELSFNLCEIEKCYKKNDILLQDKNNDAQAPGKPTKEDGFIPYKNWDGKKVKNPNGSGSGWPDHKSNV